MKGLNYRTKVPLQIVLVVVVTAVTISAAALGHAWRDAERELSEHGESLGRVLAESLAPVMLRDDLWRAWEVVNTPMEAAMEEHRRPSTIIVLDRRALVYVSSDPERFRVQTMLGVGDDDGGTLETLAKLVREEAAGRLRDDTGWWLLIPVAMDGARLGTVLMRYDRPGFFDRFHAGLIQVVVATLAVLAALLPLGWWMGWRVAQPLIRLTHYIEAVGRHSPGELAAAMPPPEGRDEVARLYERFAAMLLELEQKQDLERQVVRSDRLAAIGRLSAGIAHEINNPLGGMLNAVNTYRRHADTDPFTQRTMSLIERGLLQIRDIVGALLVEARITKDPLTRSDVQDVRMLVDHDLRQRSIQLDWRVDLPEAVPVPATPVRQILINLLLNAVRAADSGGEVTMRAAFTGDELVLEVSNDGGHISESQKDRLFEPFADTGGSGTGLGLWVTYQLVEQLGGGISVDSRPGDTCFRVTLPVAPEQAADRGERKQT